MLTDDLARLGYLALLLVAIGGFLVVEFRRNPGQTSRQMLAWGLIFVGMVAVGGLWPDIRQQIAPHQEIVTPGRIEVPLASDGHFHLTAEINGTPVRFVVDTGASTLALRQRDAGRVGIEPDSLAYTGRSATANGVVSTAPVRLGLVEIGPFRDENVPAVVIGGELDRSLMGMDYLRRFATISIAGDRLILER